jgi:U3 small nucleolar RNA-associated protein 4
MNGEENYDINHNRKLLKTIVVKGDSNIASATISEDGTLLIVSTATDVKAFRLEHDNPEKPADVKLSSLELPQNLTKLGASRVQLSPNAAWLCLIQDGSRVVMADITAAPGKGEDNTIVLSIQRLTRLQRSIPRYILNGGLGRYDRNITHAAFSPDSKFAAVADLAGYIDTWVLHGTGHDLRNGRGDNEAADAASASESESSDDEEGSTGTFVNGRWARNPNAKLIPKLPSSPAVLTFSDDVAGNGGADDYTLAAVTSSWNVLTFHPTQGSLTPWSRRHPRRNLPGPVQDLLDLAKGAFWQGPRLWIYGVSFLLMLDTSQNMPVVGSDKDAAAVEVAGQQGLKRKRIGPTSGAGGRMEKEGLKPHQIRKFTDDKWEDVEVDPRNANGEDDGDSDDEMLDGPVSELTQLRGAAAAGKGGKPNATESDDDERKRWWITYKFRPILGVVPLEADSSLEVALVERPTWDVDMSETYYAGEEWERK